MTIKSWLDFLFYDVGKQQYNFRVNGLKKKEDGSVYSTKWKSYMEIISPIDFNEDHKIKFINNREMLPCEVVIDLEQEKGINEIIKKIEDDELYFYVFKTGSRGFHIHIFFSMNLSNNEKMSIIKRYGGDEMKAYNGTTIALEYSPHWKTGRTKELWK